MLLQLTYELVHVCAGEDEANEQTRRGTLLTINAKLLVLGEGYRNQLDLLTWRCLLVNGKVESILAEHI